MRRCAEIVGLPIMVSIHASVKDATFTMQMGKTYRYVSIHASVKDATIYTDVIISALGFNPRICKRCDIARYSALGLTNVSIHASVKDATIFSRHSSYFYKVSIHASVKDATVADLDICHRCTVSIHASVKDATQLTLPHGTMPVFQSTHL